MKKTEVKDGQSKVEKREIPFLLALSPIALLIALLTINVFLFDDTLDGANQIALILSSAVAAVFALMMGYKWKKINKQIIKTIGKAMPSILILLFIGSLAGTWLISGIVPTMVYYGLKIINPTFFLVTATVVCAIVSVVTGSSWSTIATIGVALIGIGRTLGFSDPIVAGAIISGAYFGDKISPLSDTTNLAPTMAGTDIFTHIRYMLQTTVPTLVITLILFTIIGLRYNPETSEANVLIVQEAITNRFNISLWAFLIPIILFSIIMLKVPALPSLLIGTLLGAVFAIFFQPEIIGELGGTGSYAKASYIGTMQAMFGDVKLNSDNEIVSQLLSTSGMAGMLKTIWLILSAMIFGGVMEGSGFLGRITRPIVEKTKSTGSLVSATVFSCLFLNTTASDQYISIVLPGRMFKKSFDQKGLKPEVLSRTLEDSGTVTSVLVPWNTCGATQAQVLGVPTFSYLPYCFFNIISPLMTMLFAWFNIKIRRKENV